MPKYFLCLSLLLISIHASTRSILACEPLRSENVVLAEIEAYESKDEFQIFLTFSPEKLSSDGSSGGLPLSPKFMILCRVRQDTGILTTHRVPWDLSLSGDGYEPKIAFSQVKGELFCVVEGEPRGISPFGRVLKSKEGIRLLQFRGLHGFRWMDDAEESSKVLGEIKGSTEIRRLKLPDWVELEDSKNIGLKINDSLVIRRTSLGDGGMLLTLKSEKFDKQFLHLYGELSGIAQQPKAVDSVIKE